MAAIVSTQFGTCKAQFIRSTQSAKPTRGARHTTQAAFFNQPSQYELHRQNNDTDWMYGPNRRRKYDHRKVYLEDDGVAAHAHLVDGPLPRNKWLRAAATLIAKANKKEDMDITFEPYAGYTSQQRIESLTPLEMVSMLTARSEYLEHNRHVARGKKWWSR